MEEGSGGVPIGSGDRMLKTVGRRPLDSEVLRQQPEDSGPREDKRARKLTSRSVIDGSSGARWW